MSVRVLGESEVRVLLPMDECIEVMAEVFGALGRGEAVLPLRSMVWLPDRSGLLGLMPACLDQPPMVGLKVLTVMPGNHGTELDSHQGAVLVFESRRGMLLAIVDASSITAIRTAAVSGLATRLLARRDAGDLAILGSGVQAASHLEAMRVVRLLRRVRVWSRSPAHAQAFAAREGGRAGMSIEPMASAREAVAGADLICTTTSAREPVLEGSWLAPGTHINAVGACFRDTRELSTDAMRCARLFVDRRESALAESGDFLIARAEGAFGDDHIRGELADLVLERCAGRGSDSEITLFKSLGLAIEDLAAAHHAYRSAEARNAGTALELGGRRQYS